MCYGLSPAEQDRIERVTDAGSEVCHPLMPLPIGVRLGYKVPDFGQ
jgi:hypothetical protein